MQARVFWIAALAAALMLPASAGIVIVNHDEWTMSDGRPNAGLFAANVANYFAGTPGGNFLIYSHNFGLDNATVINAVTAAGHTITANTAVTFDLPTLSAYTGIFLGGYLGNFDAAVLTNYVNNGGRVYLAGGTGSIANEDSVWDPFLNNFGFEFGSSYNGIIGTFAPASGHPIFNSISSLYYNNGNTVILTGGNPAAQILESYNEQGLIGIYEQTPIPEPATFGLAGLALLSGALLVRRRS